MVASEQLNRLRALKAKILNTPNVSQSASESVPNISAATPAATPAVQTPAVTVDTSPVSAPKSNKMPLSLDASFVITPETQYDEWGMPIVTPKDIKNGLFKMREQQTAEVTTTKSAVAESINNVQPQTDPFGIPIINHNPTD